MVEVTGGASITSKQPKRMLTGLRSVRCSGNRVWLADGQEYLDWQAGLRGDLFGYAPSWWAGALSSAVERGPASSIAYKLEQIVADLFGELYPDIESIRFMLNGSDPCAAAVKLARAITGRDNILVYGYHGTASAYAAGPTDYDADDNRLGTTQAEKNAYEPLDWLDEPECDGNKIAAIIIECPPVDRGKKNATEWLNCMVRYAHEHGALFVLDEVVTGFRYAPGGASEYYQLQGKVDLYTFGKTLGNGFPIAALAGKKSIMDWLMSKPSGGGKVHWSNTFNGEPLGLAAAKATLRQLLDQRPWDGLCEMGEYLKEQWNALGLPWTMVGHPTRPILEGPDEEFDNLRRHLFNCGHILVKHPLYVTTGTIKADVDSLIEETSKCVF